MRNPEYTRNIALCLRYEGTAYHGWQVQKELATVCGTVQNAVKAVVGHPVSVTGCGRTDAGVHARMYVANFRTSSRIPADRIPYALNTHLPLDIVVTAACDVAEDFNAIGSCRRKEYTYYIYNSRLRDPFYINRAWLYPKHLDEGIMDQVAQALIGTHDFAALRSVGTNVSSTVRTVYDCHCWREDDLVAFRVSANGFLYNMVRAMVGTAVFASEGKLSPDQIHQLLQRGDRTAAGPTAPPGGLYMTRLWYYREVERFGEGFRKAVVGSDSDGRN